LNKDNKKVKFAVIHCTYGCVHWDMWSFKIQFSEFERYCYKIHFVRFSDDSDEDLKTLRESMVNLLNEPSGDEGTYCLVIFKVM